MSRFLTALLLIALAGLATAQERPRTILVLDGSGSMWGQIEGINKIVIAREVIGDLLQSFPPEQELGLTVYGHRRKGDCNDIETVIDPGQGTTGAIIDAVNTINPRGKTPLSAAVMAAAEALRFTEERATVILVSDGIETCNVDPCEVGRQLEALGVDFTAHVVGFDVDSDPEARAQLQCLAEETGGIFRTAANALELNEALGEVTEAAPPPPAPLGLRFVALDGAGGPEITEGLEWTVFDGLGNTLLNASAEAAPSLTLPPGDYGASVTRAEDGASGAATVTLSQDGQVVPIVLPELTRPVTALFRATEGAGGPVVREGVVWTLATPDGATLLQNQPDPQLNATVLPGTYVATVTRPEDGAVGTATVTVSGPDQVFTVVLPELARPVDVTFRATEGENGPPVFDDITWSVSNALGIPVLSANTEGRPTAALEPGVYTVTVLRGADGAVGEASFTVTDRPETITVVLPEVDRPQTVTFLAKAGGINVSSGLTWIANDADGTVVMQDSVDASPTAELMPGRYSVSVLRAEDGAQAVASFTVEDTAQTVTLILPELPPEPVRIQVVATDGPNGSWINDTLVWDLSGPDGPILTSEQTARLVVELPEGTYTVSVLRPNDEASAELRFGVGSSGKTVTLALPEYRPAATLTAPDTAPMGATIPIEWTGPNAQNDFISVTELGGPENRWINYTYTKEGPLLDLLMPPAPGTYEIRYVLEDGRKTLATRQIEVTPVTATVAVSGTLVAGNTVQVDWTGPGYRDDFLAVLPGDGGRWVSYTYAREGAPLTLQLPSEPGDYQVAYIMGQRDTVLTTLPITVTDTAATVAGPPEGIAGDTVPVTWTGPDYQGDYIAVTERGEDRWLSYTYTREGAPLDLQLPAEPGDYDIVYVMTQNDRILARTEIAVSRVGATVSAPSEAAAGDTIGVTWTGPDYQGDFIAVVDRGADRWLTYTYTRDGTPLELVMPIEPGDYDIVYILNQGDRVIARQPVTVTGVAATLSAPPGGSVGETVDVTWTGPDYPNDYIAIVPRDDDRWLTYTYTRDGSPLGLRLPTEPGDYDVAYVVSQDRTIIARAPITVSETSATLAAPDTLPAGATVAIDWTGPDYRNDFIAVFDRGGDQWINYTYTRDGTPLDLLLPNTPGDYDIAYVMNQDRRELIRIPVTVTGITASLDVPASARAGSAVTVTWDGPDYRNDTITVAEAGGPEGRYIHYTYTREGSPLELQMPSEPGTYEIRYVQSQGRLTMARASIEVTAVEARLTAPAEAPIGSELSVAWEGPGYQNDFIAIAPAGAPDGQQTSYTYTRTNNPLSLTLPPVPGEYELRYMMNAGGRVILARLPITLTPVTATLDAPARAPAGSTLEIAWTGPGYRNDYIEVVAPGEGRAGGRNSFFTRSGNPGVLDLPETPGTYILRYMIGQDRTIVHSQEIVVE